MTELKLDPMKYFMVKILWKRVFYDGKPVIVLTEFPPKGNLPAITMSTDGGLGLVGEMTQYVFDTLDEDHPLYDANNPYQKYCVGKKVTETHKKLLTLHVWGVTGKDRDDILKQVKRCIRLAKMNHYSMCTKFDVATHVCETTGEQCDALSVYNDYSAQGMCPFLDITDETSANYRNPQTYFDVTLIHQQNTEPRGDSNLDQLDLVPEVYHSSLPVDITIDEVIMVETTPYARMGGYDGDVLPIE